MWAAASDRALFHINALDILQYVLTHVICFSNETLSELHKMWYALLLVFCLDHLIVVKIFIRSFTTI